MKVKKGDNDFIIKEGDTLDTEEGFIDYENVNYDPQTGNKLVEEEVDED